MKEFILIIVFIGVNILLAFYDSYRIKNNLRIRHGINAIIYCIIIALFFNWLSVTKVLGLLLIRIPIFNTFLNIFRGLPYDYLSSSTTSIIDRIMNNFIKKIGYLRYNMLLIVMSILLILIK